MDIDILIDTIINTTENEENTTELEKARNQILGIAQPKIQITRIDDIEFPREDRFREKVMNTYRKAIKEEKEVEFDKRVRAKDFLNSIRNGVGDVKINRNLSNKPNKKR